MSAIKKTAWLMSLEDQTEQFLSESIADFQNMDQRILLAPSPSGGWSIVECLAHLNSYGDYYFPHLEMALQKASNASKEEYYKPTWLGNWMIRSMDVNAWPKWKFKAVAMHLPEIAISPQAVVAEFINQQEIMIQFLRKAQLAPINHQQIPVSVASWITLSTGDVLQFLVTHTHRHFQQAKRNMALKSDGQ